GGLPAAQPRATQRAEGGVPSAASPCPRIPLLDRTGQLAGFEVLPPEVMLRRAREGANLATLAAYANMVLASLKPIRAAGRAGLTILPWQLLERPAVLQNVPPGASIVIDGLGAAPEAQARELIGRLQAQHAVVGSSEPTALPVQFLFIDARVHDGQARQALVQSHRAAHAGVPWVIVNLPDVDAIEAALRDGAELAAGRLDRSALPAEKGAPGPQVAKLCRLINQLVSGADTAVLATELRSDVALSYQLLRHANSPLMGVARVVDSVDQAVLLMGRDALYRWLTVMLVSAGERRASSRALQEIALARARLFELLAPKVNAAPQSLFTLGLLSMIDVLLQLPMADAVAPLSLADNLQAALVRRAGLLAPLLSLAEQLERRQLPDAEVTAGLYGGIEAVLAASEEAWGWAAQAAAELRA
ncbi:MAG TPA: HDOD domain-containing protein, partial [Burkholderiaceae bacterium]|nr:HDOD domain-containing protein [Burkholderiaceae bacterium]